MYEYELLRTKNIHHSAENLVSSVSVDLVVAECKIE